MAENQVYQPLQPNDIKAITDSIEIGYQLISVTLITSDELIGGLAKHWGWNGEEVSIGFNTHRGQMFGMSHIIRIPLELIADVKPIPLADESLPMWSPNDPYLVRLREKGMDDSFNKRSFVQDYPNPWATLIERHNLEICKRLGLKVGGYGEAALSRESVPPEGILLSRNFMLYTDWDFFSRQMHGAVSINASIGMTGVTKDFSPSLQVFVFKHLHENFQKIKEFQDVLQPSGVDEAYIRGCILMPKPAQDTEIEGERCILITCGNAENTGEAAYPVLLKQKYLKYPIELLDLVRSSLIFYGEFLPLPIEVFGIKQEYTILARAIAYLQ